MKCPPGAGGGALVVDLPVAEAAGLVALGLDPPVQLLARTDEVIE